ncbi:MAG: recombination-associated protein RdgC [Cocleimonas sp.]
MWFKNLYLFKFEKDFPLNAEELHGELEAKPFTPCSATQRESMGWLPPLGKNTTSYTHASNNYILLTMARQERLLPSTVVKETMQEKVEAIEEAEGRKVSSREKKEMKEDIEHELLPRAFTRTQKLDAWIDPTNGWLILNSSSAPRAEEFTKLLRKTIGSLPVTLPDSETSPAVAMTEWLSSGRLPEPFTLGFECELKNQGDDKGSATFKQHDLTLDEIQSSLKAGKFASKLAIEWDEKISFVLSEDLQIKKLKFLDVLEEQLQDNDPQSYEEHMDIQFALMTGEVASLLKDLMKALN